MERKIKSVRLHDVHQQSLPGGYKAIITYEDGTIKEDKGYTISYNIYYKYKKYLPEENIKMLEEDMAECDAISNNSINKNSIGQKCCIIL